MGDVAKISEARVRAVPGVVDVLEHALEEARAGNIRNVAIVAEASAGAKLYTAFGFENNSVLLGLLEYVKHRIMLDMGD